MEGLRRQKGTACMALIVCLLHAGCATAAREFARYPDAPRWPLSYRIDYEFSLPYVQEYQKGGLVYPVTVWKDGNKRFRQDTYNSENVLIKTKHREIELVPRLNKTVCLIFDNSDAVRSAKDESAALSIIDGSAPVLPEVTKEWNFEGIALLNGEDVNLWRYEHKREAKHIAYNFYVREDGSPVRLHQHGNDLFSGAHIDNWLYTFTSYVPGPIAGDVFEKPTLCHGVEPGSRAAPSSFALRMKQLLPHAPPGGRDLLYDRFAAEQRRQHGSPQEYHMRLAVFRSNVQLIGGWNEQKQRSYTLAVNRWADWSEEEFRMVMLPGQGNRANLPEHPPGRMHQAVVPAARIPSTVDWRNTGADGPVKDQSACGSCWAFGGTHALQSAIFIATGESVLLSEQHLMDCSWGHTENKACDGGLYEGAYDYLIEKNLPLALESDYPYRGQDGFCKDNETFVGRSPARIKGYKAIPQGDTAALMEAVYTKGPIAISIDAARPSFRFYSAGVYDDPACKYKKKDLDHSVTLMGYGSTKDGRDYWIMKNSWSKYWGNSGYMLISRDHHACGVATDAVYPVVDVDNRYTATAES